MPLRQWSRIPVYEKLTVAVKILTSQASSPKTGIASTFLL
jgi:hypothetical protein